MNRTISRRQINLLESEQKVRDETGKKLTMSDKLLDLFLPVKVGVLKNGLTSKDIAKAFEAYTFQELSYIRVQICELQSSLVKDGFPFGGIKDGRLKKYGFPNEKEFAQIEMSRKERLLSEVTSGKKYLEDEDPLLSICNKMIKECDKQLKLFNE